jgi:hypothetical protein
MFLCVSAQWEQGSLLMSPLYPNSRKKTTIEHHGEKMMLYITCYLSACRNIQRIQQYLTAGCSDMTLASATLAAFLRKWASGCPYVCGNAWLITWAPAGSAAIATSPYSTLTVVPWFTWGKKSQRE